MRPNKIKKIGYRALCVIEALLITCIVLIALINAVVFVQTKMLDYVVPNIFGYSYVHILSSSMEPNVSAGDLVICKVQDKYEVDDPVLFEDQEYLVLHRIVGVNEDGEFVTRGDANTSDDKYPVPAQNVRGKMVAVLPGIGSTIQYVTSRTGAIWTLLAVFFIYMTLDVGKSLLKESNDESDDIIDVDYNVLEDEESNNEFEGYEDFATVLSGASESKDNEGEI